MYELQKYIKENIKKCIRHNRLDSGTLIGLPYPYTVPCVSGTFQEMYYWDTYFTNKGLILSGEINQAKNNASNMFFLISKYGFVPNGNRIGYLRNSQPPFLSLMVYDIYEVTRDKKWLEIAYSALCIEHKFWTNKRMTSIGLNRYDGKNNNYETDSAVADYMCSRIGFRPNRTDSELTRAMLSAGESGWDLNPRMTYNTYKFAPIDLNSLMYAMEKNLSYFASELNMKDEALKWQELAVLRAELCRKYLCKNKVFYDYNVEEKEICSLVSVACFYPMYCNMANSEEAENTRKLLLKLETEYGVLTCEKNSIKGVYQWDYPNGWAPMQLVVVLGLLNYGYKDDAVRISKKFVELIEKTYLKTGELWEKYNIVNGNIEVAAEYETPTMLGWTFGVYKVLKEILKNEK